MQLGILDLGPVPRPDCRPNRSSQVRTRARRKHAHPGCARSRSPGSRFAAPRREESRRSKEFLWPMELPAARWWLPPGQESEIALLPAGRWKNRAGGLCGRPFCARYSPGGARWIAWQVHRPFRSRTLLNEFTRPASAIWWSRRSCRVVIHLEHRPCPPRSFRHARRRCFRPARFQSSSRCR